MIDDMALEQRLRDAGDIQMADTLVRLRAEDKSRRDLSRSVIRIIETQRTIERRHGRWVHLPLKHQLVGWRVPMTRG